MIAEQKSVDAQQVLQAVANFQQKFGGEIIPSAAKKKTEIFYNNLNPLNDFPY
jgi:hypothetical protein